MATSGTSSATRPPTSDGSTPPAISTTSAAIEPSLPLTTMPPPAPPLTAIPTDALNAFTKAIQGLQNQMALMNVHIGDLATRVSAIDDRALPVLPGLDAALALPAASVPGISEPAPAAPTSSAVPTAAPSAPLVSAPASTTLPATATHPFGVPIGQICFPHLLSPVPSQESILRGSVPVSSAPMASPTSRVHVPPELEGQVVPKYHKLVFPTFDGKEDPLGWLNKCEQFFNGHQTRHADRVWLASYHLTGVAQQWYLVLEADAGRPQWEEFRTLCQQRFGPPLGTNHLSDLARLPFTSTVDAYMEAFQARAAHVGRLSPGQKAKLFTGGLPSHIRVDVELHDPQDLQRAMHLARAYERRNAPAPLALPAQQRRRLTGAPPIPPALSAATSAAASSSTTTPQRAFKRLSPDEMAERRKQGLCYNCDEPYVRGHKCARLFFLEATNYIVEEPDDADDAPATPSADTSFDPDKPLISLSAITGIRTADTMQLCVRVGEHELTALLDSGSTHNFISGAAARRAELQFHDSGGAHVVVANGDRVMCRGLARDVDLRTGGETFKVDCYSIPLDSYDMVLGVTWLRTLGPILWDFNNLCMAFTYQGRRVLCRGVGSPSAAFPPTGGLLAARGLSAKGTEPAPLECLLDSYADVFVAPTGLPPARACDHRIHLKPSTEPVAVRPYRYP
ncbi:uncharacterized protein [Miscanthus floridulus]|uniref:uncharacterized protein n=1 Tax=Miscanthus floridulus TaxID=154761 RepID=UPI003459A26F